MSDKWEHSLVVPTGQVDERTLQETRRFIGYGIRAVFSKSLRRRARPLPVSYLQSHRGFPRKCPEQYCSAAIRLEPEEGCFFYHGRGQTLRCYDGHRFVCFRFGRSMVLAKLDLYLARLGAAKWQQLIAFPARSAYGRGLLRALWDAPYEEVLCGAASPKEARVVAGWRGLRRRFARQLQDTDRAAIKSNVQTCLDLCSQPPRAVRDYIGAVEFACDAGHRLLASRSERGTFLATRLALSFTQAAESL